MKTQKHLEGIINIIRILGVQFTCIENSLFIFLLLIVLVNIQDQTQACPRLLYRYNFSRKLFALPGRYGWGA